MARIVVGMSGGVDSAVAAWLLKEQGHEVSGLFMKNWEDDDEDGYCPAKQDLHDVLAVADVIGIDVDGVNFAREYRERVFAYFLEEYSAGRTPNPDVLCNSEIKFRAFLDHALSLGADAIATGHYAVVTHAAQHMLRKAIDQSKDQSYFLHRLNQDQLEKTLFPLGGLLKKDVRELARRINLPVAEKKDSTGICFIGERPFRDFLERYLPRKPGEMRTPEGKLIGAHDGLMYYTIGQRQGLQIGGPGEPWFVAGKDLARNELIVVQGHDHPALYSRRLRASAASWISDVPRIDRPLAAKTRYRQPDAPCRLIALDNDSFELEFAAPQWAITPGQSAVLYDDDICLGGGVIEA